MYSFDVWWGILRTALIYVVVPTLVLFGLIAVLVNIWGRGYREPYEPRNAVFPTGPEWTADGTQLVFGHRDSIYVAASDGSSVELVHGGRGDEDVNFYPRVSPDGSKIAFMKYRHVEWLFRVSHHWEIAISELDGSVGRLIEFPRRRSSRGIVFRSPTWGPEESWIAYSSASDVYVEEVGGPGARSIVNIGELGENSYITGLPLAWSPDGRRIAFFVGVDRSGSGDQRGLYTVGVDGSGLKKIAERTGAPAWSPDGSRIAFANWELSRRRDSLDYTVKSLNTIAPDGSDLREIISFPRGRFNWGGGFSVPSGASWSPDGSGIIFGKYTAASDGSTLQFRLGKASWSPDGSRIAVQISGSGSSWDQSQVPAVLYVVDRYGSDARVLVDPTLSPAHGVPLIDLLPLRDSFAPTTIYFDRAGPRPEPVDTGQCSNGIAVEGPIQRPLLVRDCETLLTLRDSLHANPPLNWSTETSMFTWEGVEIGGSGDPETNAVIGLRLPIRDLTGFIADDLGLLTSLVELDLSENWLSGGIPGTLGQLANLRVLRLSGNRLSGEIPAELGRLEGLQTLDVGSNRLGGEIPAELGRLESLETLDVRNNRLSGGIPETIGSMERLKRLDLSNNQISGPIPKELGNLLEMEHLDMSVNELTGSLPGEMGRLIGLKVVYLNYNDLSGSVPPEWIGMESIEKFDVTVTRISPRVCLRRGKVGPGPQVCEDQ